MNKSSLRFWGFTPSGLRGVNVVDWLDERRYAQYPTPSEDPSTDSPAQSLLRKWLHEDGLDLDTPKRLIFKLPDHQEIDLEYLENILERELKSRWFTVNMFQDVLFLESSINISESQIRDMTSMNSASRRLRRRYRWVKEYNEWLFGYSPQNQAPEEDETPKAIQSDVESFEFCDLRPEHRLASSLLKLPRGASDPQPQTEPIVSKETTTGYHKPCSIFKASITSSAERSGGSQVQLVAVKKFSSMKTSSHSKDFGDFDDLRDFDGIEKQLRKVNQLRHPNLAETITVFRSRENDDSEEISWNVVSPLAACDLEQLFHYQIRDGPVVPPTQLVALTSAVAYLHETLKIAHSSIRPSNILVYQHPGSSEVVLKLADFSSAGIKELRLPMTEQWRQHYEFSLSQDLREDIVALGCVFVELVAFMTKGRRAVVDLRRSITSSRESISTDGFYDGYHIIQKLLVKKEVFHWIHKFPKMLEPDLERGLPKSSGDDWARKVLPVIERMLEMPRAALSSARGFCQNLLQAVEHNIFDPQYRFSDGLRIFRFTVASQSQQPRWHDKLRIRLERQFGSTLDWSPLPDVTYPCRKGEMTVTWKYGNRNMSKVVSTTNGKTLMYGLRRVFSNGSPLLPVVRFGERHINPGPGSGKQPEDGTSHALKSFPKSQHSGGTPFSTVHPRNVIPHRWQDRMTKEIYLCVDRILVEVQQTTLCPIHRVNTLSDDKALLCKMREQLHSCNGWIKNLISWKTCTEVKFVMFKVARDRDVVPMSFALPERPHDYEYKHSNRPEFIKVYLETVVARNVLCGIHDRAVGAGETDLIDHILKKRNPPQLDTSADAYGLRAMQGLSLKKICCWSAVSYILGLAFVIFWLSFVDKLDLQNAFMPVTVLATMLVGALATTQVLV